MDQGLCTAKDQFEELLKDGKKIGLTQKDKSSSYVPAMAVPSTYAMMRQKSWETVAFCGLKV